MARYRCARCDAECNTLDPEHLCKDVAARLREAMRRALAPCQGRGSLDSYLTRMNYLDPDGRDGPRVKHFDFLVNGHGQFVDANAPETHDVAAREMLAARSQGG